MLGTYLVCMGGADYEEVGPGSVLAYMLYGRNQGIGKELASRIKIPRGTASRVKFIIMNLGIEKVECFSWQVNEGSGSPNCCMHWTTKVIGKYNSRQL